MLVAVAPSCCCRHIMAARLFCVIVCSTRPEDDKKLHDKYATPRDPLCCGRLCAKKPDKNVMYAREEREEILIIYGRFHFLSRAWSSLCDDLQPRALTPSRPRQQHHLESRRRLRDVYWPCLLWGSCEGKCRRLCRRKKSGNNNLTPQRRSIDRVTDRCCWIHPTAEVVCTTGTTVVATEERADLTSCGSRARGIFFVITLCSPAVKVQR